MERKYADLQEQLNIEMRQGHKACLRLNGLIRKLNSLKAFVQAKKDDAKSQLEEYVNKLSECLLEFRSEMLVQLDGAHRDKFVEIAELREGYEMDINTFSRLFEEAEKYVQFDRRFRIDDNRNIQNLLGALRQILADQPDDKEMTDILHLEFKPSIPLASIGPSLFGNVEKVVGKPGTTQDPKSTAEKPIKSNVALEHKENQIQAQMQALQITAEKQRPRPTEPSVENKGNPARVQAKDMQAQTEMPYQEILQQSLRMLQGPTYPAVNLQQNPGVNYQQQPIVNLQQQSGVNYQQQPIVNLQQQSGVNYQQQPIVNLQQQSGVNYQQQPIVNLQQQSGVNYQQQPTVNLQQPPGFKFQQQCSGFGQAPTVLYPCVSPVYSPPGFAGNSPLLYGTQLQISPLQTPPCFQGSTDVEKVVRRARKKISMTKTKSPLDDGAGKSCSKTTADTSALKCQDDKVKENIEGKAKLSTADVTIGDVASKDYIQDKTRRSPREMVTALRKGNRVTAVAKKQKAISEKNTVDEDCYIVEKIDNETIDLTESHHSENPLESSRESAGSLDSGIMSPPGLEHHLKENLVEKQQIFLPLKPLRRPLRLPKMMSDCQRTSVLETESKKRTADHGLKQNVMESIKDICRSQSDSSNNAAEAKSHTDTKVSQADESDKENNGQRVSSGIRRTAVIARRRLAKIQEKNDCKAEENKSPGKEEERVSVLSNKTRLEAENNVSLKRDTENSSKAIHTAVDKEIKVTAIATSEMKPEKKLSIPNQKKITTITSDKEFYEKIWNKNVWENVAVKEPSAEIKAEDGVKPHTDDTPEKAAAVVKDNTETSQSNEETPLTKDATLEKNTQQIKPEHKTQVPPTNSEHENMVPQIQSQHESNVPQIKSEQSKAPQTSLEHENKVPQINSEREDKVPHIQSEHESKAPQAKEDATKDDVAQAASRSEKKATLQKQTRQLAQCVRDFLGEEKPASYSRLGAVQAHWLKHSYGDIAATFQFQLGNSLKFPIGVTSDREGNVVVTDTGNNLVKKFDCNGNILTVLGKDMFPPLKRPSAVVVNGNNEVFVKDDACIHKFDSQGKYVMAIGQQALSRPFGLDLTPAGYLITLTTHPRQPMLIQLSQDGEKVFSFIFTPLLNAPYGSKCRFLAVSDNTVIVSDLGLSKIYLTNLEGLYIGEFGCYGSGPEDFLEPSGITVDSFGNVLIGDSKNNRIKMYRQNGTYIGQVQLDCSIVRPSGIHLTRDNKIIVVNFLQHHVKVFKLAN